MKPIRRIYMFQKKIAMVACILSGMSINAFADFFSSRGVCMTSGIGAKCKSPEAALNCIAQKHPEISDPLSKLASSSEKGVRITISQKDNGFIGFAKATFSMAPLNGGKGLGQITNDVNCLSKLHNYIITSDRKGNFVANKPSDGDVGTYDHSRNMTNIGICRTTLAGAKCTSAATAINCLKYEMGQKGLDFASVSAIMSGGSGAYFQISQAHGGYYLTNTQAYVTVKPYAGEEQDNTINYKTDNPNCLRLLNGYAAGYDQNGKLVLYTPEQLEEWGQEQQQQEQQGQQGEQQEQISNDMPNNYANG
ncbi:MAG: hypothetical protein HEEMFOPI_00471 [Holosporales bacterium]